MNNISWDTENTAVTENTENATDWAYVYDESDNKAKEETIWELMCDGFMTPEEARQALGNTENAENKEQNSREGR